MNHATHYVLIALALWFNAKEPRAFLLSAIVGLSVIIPIPAKTAAGFYFMCGAAELIVGALALWLNTTASRYVVTMCVCLLAFHLLGFYLDGYPQNSPYRILVKIAEYAEIISCIVLSKPILEFIYKCRQN